MRKITFTFISICFVITLSACGVKSEKNTEKALETTAIHATNTTVPQTSTTVPEPTTAASSLSSPSDLPVTDENTVEQFVVDVSVPDRQIFDKTNSTVIEALNSYRSVLVDNAPVFCYPYQNPNPYEDIRNLSQLCDFIAPNEIEQFSIIDIDNDTIPEVIFSYGEYKDFFFILKYYAGNVLAYERGLRSFNQLKIDGTFIWANSGSDVGIGRILFKGSITSTKDIAIHNDYERTINDKSVTEEDYRKANAYQQSKPNVTWYDFSEENINKYLL